MLPGRRGTSTLRAGHNFDAWRPRGTDLLKTVGYGRSSQLLNLKLQNSDSNSVLDLTAGVKHSKNL
jgi:hypothetical protein